MAAPPRTPVLDPDAGPVDASRPRSIPRVRSSLDPPPAPGPGKLALRFTGRDRGDVPKLRLRAGEVTLLEGRAGVEAMRHRLVIDCAVRGRSVMHVVGGNRLDSTRLARRAQAKGLDPGYVLRASVVARGFTAYQLSVLLEERLPAHLDEHPSAAVALVSDPLALYTDEDVGRTEGTRLAEGALDALGRAASEHDRPIVVVQPPTPARRPAPGRRDASPGPSRERVAELMALVRDHADRRVRVAKRAQPAPADGARVVELPGPDRRVRIAEPRAEQARLDRFVQEA